MITISLSLAITLYIVAVVGLVLLFWLDNEGRSNRDRLNLTVERDTIHCEFCGNIYADTPKEQLSCCPRCGSYNEVS